MLPGRSGFQGGYKSDNFSLSRLHRVRLRGLIPSSLVLAAVESVPHLETALLLRRDPKAEWDARMVVEKLYIAEARAARILEDLRASGLIVVNPGNGRYHYEPIYLGLREKMDLLAEAYNKNLKEVTNLIHSKITKQAQELGDAFKWQG